MAITTSPLCIKRYAANERVFVGASTVAPPLIERMAVSFSARSGDGDWRAGSGGINYKPLESLGGFIHPADPEFDFAITDYSLSAIRRGTAERDAVQFPLFVGGIALAYPLDELPQ